MVSAKITEKLKNLPLTPGVYLMKDSEGGIIYIGKSKVLKNRVSQYFQKTANHSPKTVAMVEKIEDFDYVLTDTEAEALALECNLIKKYRPKYNILLKDDKQFPYIKITMNEDYPRIIMTRRVVKDGGLYFGPYMSGFMVRDTLDVIKKIFMVRSCKKVLPRDIGKERPCLLHHLKLCSAPCANLISKDEYRETFSRIEDVLKGNYKEILNLLENKMRNASENMEYEKAASYRDKIKSITALSEKQKISSAKENSRDVFGIYLSDTECCIQVFYIREGKVIGTENFIFERNNNTPKEIVEAFIKQFYYASTNLPKEIIIPEEFDEMEDVENWLSNNSGHKVHLIVPKRGEKLRLLEMVSKNAEESYKIHKFKRDKENADGNIILSELRTLLNLDAIPYRIESYDISNISGSDSVGVRIVYQNAKPLRRAYRKFNIKTVEGADDYKSMQEVVQRRFLEAYKEEEALATGELTKGNEKFLPLPDLILLDGGKGHVASIKEVLEDLSEEIPVFGIVKNDKHQTRGLTDEKEEILLQKDGELFKFLACMQDEVHDFAIKTFRNKHEKSMAKSALENIVGIGPQKRKKLLMYFKSIDKIKEADLNTLEIVLDKKSATQVYNYFNK